MREPKSIEGARALLFERLVDLDPQSLKEEPHPLRLLDRQQLKESVRRELGRLLNTRSSTPTPLFVEQELTVLDYGIPDFSSFSARNADDHRRMEKIIKLSINAFEPRLRDIQVTVEPVTNSTWSLRVGIDAFLVIDSLTEAVSFQVVVQNKSGRAEVHES
jgi:type VI secretion system lysozyme-like protein